MGNTSITHHKVDGGLEKICAYLISDGKKPLSEALQSRLDKMDFVDNLIRNGRQAKQIMGFLQKKYKKEKISRPTAYRIIADAKYVFNSTSIRTKDYDRSVAIDLILDTRARARKKGDFKTMSMCDSNYIKVTGVDRDDIELPDMSKIQPPVQLIQINNQFLDKAKSMLPKEVYKIVEKQAKVISKNTRPDNDA